MKDNNGVRNLCNVCKKDADVEDGCHLEGGLDFCSVACLCEYTENVTKSLFKTLENHNKRLSRLEERYRTLKADIK